MITASVVLDSVSEQGSRLTTMVWRYPRFIHAEVMTHRMLSRNAASSRAIPVKKMIEQVINDPAMPVFWGKNQPGMQAAEPLDEYKQKLAEHHWLAARIEAVDHVRVMMDGAGLHKQIANRILEPWMWMTMIVSATDWGNFFALRRHPDAQPEIKVLADAAYDALVKSTPQKVSAGQWHMPFIQGEDLAWAFENLKHYGTAQPCGYALSHGANPAQIFEFGGPAPESFYFQKLSVARCARVSYLNHDGTKPNPQKDLELHDKLIEAPHASPFEHVATPETGRYGNFNGWKQYRQLIPNENITIYPGI